MFDLEPLETKWLIDQQWTQFNLTVYSEVNILTFPKQLIK